SPRPRSSGPLRDGPRAGGNRRTRRALACARSPSPQGVLTSPSILYRPSIPARSCPSLRSPRPRRFYQAAAYNVAQPPAPPHVAEGRGHEEAMMMSLLKSRLAWVATGLALAVLVDALALVAYCWLRPADRIVATVSNIDGSTRLLCLIAGTPAG